MFNFKSTFNESEMISDMEESLLKQASSNLDQQQNIKNHVLTCLTLAANLLDESDLVKEAEEITYILGKFADMDCGELKSDPATSGLTEKKMVGNLLDHGTMFNNADDFDLMVEDEPEIDLD